MGQSFTRSILVRHMEATLRTAVVAQHAATPGIVRDAKTKAVKRIASKLLAARLQLLRSRLAGMPPLATSGPGVRLMMERMEARGVAAILKEFGADKDQNPPA